MLVGDGTMEIISFSEKKKAMDFPHLPAFSDENQGSQCSVKSSTSHCDLCLIFLWKKMFLLCNGNFIFFS